VRLGFGITGVAFATMTAYLLNGAVMTAIAFGALCGRRAVPAHLMRLFLPLVLSLGLAYGVDKLVLGPGAPGIGAHLMHAALQIALYLPLYGVVAYAFGRGIGLRQLVLDLRPAWTRRSTEAGS
jgi:hypothetical protein